MTIRAVLTGDVVGSGELAMEERSRLADWLGEAAAHVGLEGRLEAFRGDSWQAYAEDPRCSLAQGLGLRGYLLGKRGVETRVSIGLGEVESLRLDRVSLSQGEAFELSGRGLTELGEGRVFALAAGSWADEGQRSLLRAAGGLIDLICSGWTAKQAFAASLDRSLWPPFSKVLQSQMAEAFDPPISPQALGRHLASARWAEVKEALEEISRGLGEALALG